MDWKKFDAAVNAIKATEIGKRMTGAGYDIYSTGGGCLAWHRAFPDGRYIYICDCENGVEGARDDDGIETWLGGLYPADDGDGQHLAETSGTLDAVMAWADSHARA